jgi:hypothetical protein
MQDTCVYFHGPSRVVANIYNIINDEKNVFEASVPIQKVLVKVLKLKTKHFYHRVRPCHCVEMIPIGAPPRHRSIMVLQK